MFQIKVYSDISYFWSLACIHGFTVTTAHVNEFSSHQCFSVLLTVNACRGTEQSPPIKLRFFICFRAYRCPLCMHSVWNMEDHWDQIDKEIAQSPMPTEYQGATVKVRPQ